MDCSKPVIVVPATTARMRTPGAVMSGFSRLKLPAGPRELKAPSASGSFWMTIDGNGMPAVVVPGFAFAKSRNALPSDCRMPNAGIVVSGTDGMMPPAALLAITTATAPAAVALATFSENGQVPRRITTIAPSSESAGYGFGKQPSAAESMPALTTSGEVPGMAVSCATPLLPGFVITGPGGSGTGCGPVTSSTVRKSPRPCCDAAVDDTHGSRWPMVFGPGPLLPAEAAT